MLRHALEAQGHTIVEARDEAEAVQAIRTARPGVVLSDLRLPQGDGFGVLRAAKELDPELPVIVMTAYGSIQDAVSAMKDGALDFLAKPVDPDHLLLMVERALSVRRLATENILLKEELAQRRGAPQIIGEDAKLKSVTVALHRAAATDATVLLQGESGTGKELFARALHVLSPRVDGPFVAINCAAIPDNLLETELFGYEKGLHRRGAAQTGQIRAGPSRHAVPGRDRRPAARASGQDPARARGKRFERVGGTTPLQVDVRVVAATNRNLKAAVAARQFREDLFFRLSVFPIVIPPLRERPSDIPMLAKFFIERYCRELKKPVLALAPSALEALVAYSWRGNVRELQNCIERAVILTEGTGIHATISNCRLPRHRSFPRTRPKARARGRGSICRFDGRCVARVVAEVERGRLPRRSKGIRQPRACGRNSSDRLQDTAGEVEGARDFIKPRCASAFVISSRSHHRQSPSPRWPSAAQVQPPGDHFLVMAHRLHELADRDV
jgi:DNA-binding NtrC family response regulator